MFVPYCYLAMLVSSFLGLLTFSMVVCLNVIQHDFGIWGNNVQGLLSF